MGNLYEEIKEAINRHCRENQSNTPDFILAKYLMDCLEVFERAVAHRDNWYGIHPEPGIQDTPAKEL